MANSSTLAWRIPWTEEQDRLQSMELQESAMTVQRTFTFISSRRLYRSLGFSTQAVMASAGRNSFISCFLICMPLVSFPCFIAVAGTSSAVLYVVVLQLLSCVQLFSNPIDCSSPDFLVHGIYQAKILEQGAISFTRGSSQPRQGLNPHLLH